MKTILEINGPNYGSTGNVSMNIALKAKEACFDTRVFVLKSREAKKHYKDGQIIYGIWLDRIISERLSLITGLRDSFNILGTYDLIKKIDKCNPDLIHLHLLHDNFINIKMFFSYLNKKNIPVIWTFHDCWPITGQCPAFEMIGCDKWINGCFNCPQWKNEPKSLLFDTSKLMWNMKRKIFSNLNNLTIVTPSDWLNNIVNKSYFSKYSINTIYNGIDLEIFQRCSSNIKEKYKLNNKKIVLGVANYWEKRKGLDVFVILSETLPNDYQIILVGTNEQIDNILPKNIISIHKTHNQIELAEIYSTADVFVNPTREDVFGLVNVEALACGTPVIVFKTGGCPEIVDDTCGVIVEKNDIDALEKNIKFVCEKKPFTKENCFTKAKQFDKNVTYDEYINLYKEKLYKE